MRSSILCLAVGATSFAAPPADVVDRWLARFDAKYARDPSFYLRPQ